MTKIFILLFIGSFSLNFQSSQAQNNCQPLSSPRYGSMMCTDGSRDRSRCTFICDEDYKLTATSSVNRRCMCREGRCFWDGAEPVCEYQAPSQADCNTPDFLRASSAVMDVWSNGAFVRITVKSSELITQGWSIALMFFKPLPENFEVESGHVSLVATSDDRRILTFNSKSHNGDISDVQIYDFFIFIKNLPENSDPSTFSALVGFYDKIISDASCIQVLSPVRPLPTTTTRPTTTRKTTTPNSRAPTNPPRTTRSTTRRTTTRRTTTRRTTTRRTTTRRTSTRRTTTRRTTTRRTTTQPPPPQVSGSCEVLDNPNEPGYRLLNRGWSQGGNTWKFQGRFEKNLRNREVKDWSFVVQFPSAVDDIDIFTAEAEKTSSDGTRWLITPKSYNSRASGDLRLNFIGTIQGGNGGPETGSSQITFCRDGAAPEAGSSNRGNNSPRSTTTIPPTTTRRSRPTSIASSPFLANCGSNVRSAFGSLPTRSSRTNPSGYRRSTARTKYDYNKALHLSVLFYEAQRSGRLPSNNRIPWRGNAGLKDGCDVKKDLTGGFYDAGDNVKFGFPMAYTMTVLAWGMIEFRDAYENSGDWQAALDILKWGTDYFIKAHTDKYELYVQVANAGRDHGMWLRPEDIDYVQKSYKIDVNNAGSDVAAETAAAMAAASIVFRSSNPTYANTLVAHAKELYEFADRYRKAYHDSVPGVASFYRSWSGFQDELLWGAMWLYKATNDRQYLNTVRSNYDGFGAGGTAYEFSWDNKHAGVQVLMAQETGERKYINNIKNFYNRFNGIKKTPRGLTWHSKWGSNRYAANFAFISIMASKVVNLGGDKAKFVNYARSQIHYILGDNEIGRPYVIGFNSNSPRRPHHRASSCPAWNGNRPPKCGFDSLNRNGANPHILYGAMVGGPDSRGVYKDDRSDYVSNEVAIDYNAGFQGAVAGLQSNSLN